MAYQGKPGIIHNDSAMSSSSTVYPRNENSADFNGTQGAPYNIPGNNFRGHYKDSSIDRPIPRQRQPFSNPERVSFAPPKSTGDLRLWRHDERGNMWVKGSKGRVIGRFVCCTLMMTVLFLLGIVLSLALWARPPDITFNGLQVPTSTSAVSVQANSLSIALQLSIGVKNPNYFSATLKRVEAKAFYPPLTDQVGGGSLYDVKFPSNSDTQFTFPFNITYSTTIDPNQILITDLVNKCGIKTGSTKQPLTVKYDISLAVSVLAVTIPPSFSGTTTFDCPVTRQDLLTMGGQALLDSLGAS
ncbi:hypothetical protein FRB93_004749 [Tulasnella sp. JGI-2019a]|nr:hypothetical protein FRB93_004749 [Tulasnella sp. JGI-2019a]